MSEVRAQPFGQQMINRAFSRFAHTVGYTCLSAVILEVIGFQAAVPTRVLWPALFPLVLSFVSLVLLDRNRTTFHTITFLVIGGFSQYWFDRSLLTQVPAAQWTNQPSLSLVNVALILVIGSGFTVRATVLWTLAGFAVGQVASVAASVQSGKAIRIDFISLFAVVILVAVVMGRQLTRNRLQTVRPGFDRAAVDEELSAMRYRIEVKAAALMHDMVLNHLAVVATAQEGALRPELKRQIEKDLEFLIGEEWLSDPSPEVDSQARTDWRSSSLLAAVQEARDLSLTIEVTGDLAAVGRLDPERDVALGLAVKQCLVNVLRHAQVERAEVVIIGSESEVSVMVIDAGRGFSEQSVSADRLGLKQSVRRRIESVGGDVRLWSTPGRGTSVMIRVPSSGQSGPLAAAHG